MQTDPQLFRKMYYFFFFFFLGGGLGQGGKIRVGYSDLLGGESGNSSTRVDSWSSGKYELEKK